MTRQKSECHIQMSQSAPSSSISISFDVFVAPHVRTRLDKNFATHGAPRHATPGPCDTTTPRAGWLQPQRAAAHGRRFLEMFDVGAWCKK